MGKEGQETGGNEASSLSLEAETQNTLASEGIQVPGCALHKCLAETACEAAAGTTQTRQLISICTKAEYNLTAALGGSAGYSWTLPRSFISFLSPDT